MYDIEERERERYIYISADLGGRVGWLPKAPKKGGGGWGGGGGRGGIPASFPSRSPPPKQPFQPTPRLPPGGLRKNRNLRGFGWGKGPGPWTGPWGLDPASHRLTSCKAKFLTSCCVSNPWVRVSKRYHNPQSADLGGRWMVSKGGAVQFHERRGSRLRSSISAAGPGPKPLQTWPTSP